MSVVCRLNGRDDADDLAHNHGRERRVRGWRDPRLPTAARRRPRGRGHGAAVHTELTFEAVGDSTRYSVRVIHARRAGALTHDEMRFSAGWSTALDQLVARMTAASGE